MRRFCGGGLEARRVRNHGRRGCGILNKLLGRNTPPYGGRRTVWRDGD
ncbi:hypothetical protein KCP77_22055 [Salmonella enterica subsp. enterica]|nr:hypothetical protein KCP77_22055 [Salmonella enterica subsp. enterica]